MKLDENTVLEPINNFWKKNWKKNFWKILKFWNMKNLLCIAGLVGLIGQSEAGITKKNTGNGIEMIIKRVRDYSRITSGTKGKNFY